MKAPFPAAGGKRTRAPGTRAGFTLIELMLALTAGTFVVSGAYYLSEVSARLFQEQLRRAETQMTLRSAGEQLRRDIGRAGLMAVRSTDELWGCDSRPVIDGGIDVVPNGRTIRGISTTPILGGGVTLFLTGNFTTSDQYPLALGSDATTLVLATGRESFRRSFIDPATGAFLNQRFAAAFAPDPDPAALGLPQGRMVSIQDLSTGRIFLRDILSVNPAAGGPQIVIDPPLPTTGGCIPSLTTLVVAPISTVRYMLEDPNLPALGDLELRRSGVGANILAGGQRFNDGTRRMVLTRREIHMRTNEPIRGTARIVLDFVSDRGNLSSFRLEGFFDAAWNPRVPGQQPRITYAIDPSNAAQVADPASLRSLLVELVAESPEAVVAVAANNKSASRILDARRLLRMEVMMPNMARNPGTL